MEKVFFRGRGCPPQGSRLDTTLAIAPPLLTAMLSKSETIPSSSSPTQYSQPASSPSSSSGSDPYREEAEGANHRNTPSNLPAGLNTTQAVLMQGEARDTEVISSSSPVSSAPAREGNTSHQTSTNRQGQAAEERRFCLCQMLHHRLHHLRKIHRHQEEVRKHPLSQAVRK